MDFLGPILFCLICVLVILLYWKYLIKKYKKINIPFIVSLFFYRMLFIPIYIEFIYGDWVIYLRKVLNGNSEFGFLEGTKGVVWLASLLDVFHLGAYGYFFAFSIFGYFGVVMFYLLIHRFTNGLDKVKIKRLNIFPWILFYPSLHMYTIMLGKDPIVLFGIALTTLALSKKNIRWIVVLLGLSSVLLVRPHMAIILVGCIVISALISYEFGYIKKILLSAAVFVAILISIPLVLPLFRVSTASLAAVIEAVEKNEGYGSHASTYIDMSSYSVPMKMFTYLFRPLFIDSPNMLLMEYSLENFFFLTLLLINLRLYFFKWIKMQPFVVKFSFVLVILGTLVLSSGINVFGLMIRQKTMVFLNFIFLLFLFMNYRNSRNTKIYNMI